MYAGRGKGSKWGNPFSHLINSLALVKVDTVDEAVDNHKKWLRGEIKIDIEPPTREEIIAELENRIIGCFCDKDERCHVDNYIEIINEGKEEIKGKDLF